LRPEFDRNQQRLSNYEQLVDHLQDPEHQAEALEALGLQLADEEDDEYDWDDENDPDERVDRIESYLEQEAELRAMAAQEDAMLDAVEDRVEALQKEHGDFSDEELETIFGIAEANPDDDGIPDVKYAYELLTKVSDARREKYLESKKGTKPPVGQAAGDNVDLDDEDGRVKALADMLEAEEATTT
jgi:hypothetical protein